jgi:L-rhamnose isomerase
MGELRGVISSKTDNTFRKIAMQKFGYKKGSLSQAMEEAIKQWIESNTTNS